MNGHASVFRIKTGDPRDLSLDLRCYILSTADVISSQLNIFADDTNIYSRLNMTSDRSNKVELGAALKNDPQSVVNSGKK